jgi:threonine aldolase
LPDGRRAFSRSNARRSSTRSAPKYTAGEDLKTMKATPTSTDTNAPSAAEKAAIRSRCARSLSFHHPHRSAPHQAFVELAAATPPDVVLDMYGEGEVLSSLEREIAGLLGKEAAIFMPSGTMAQQIALRIWADRSGRRSVAFHPTCHLEQHEEKGYQRLHNLHGVLVGSPHRLLTLADLKAVADPLAAVLIELPQREIGGQLPSWDDLVAVTSLARDRGARVHLDGARLWEARPYYKRDLAEIAALFDSVYVSLYKGLGGIAGAVLLGSADVIAEARVWRRRHGGTLVHLFPYAIAARAAMAERLDKMESYYAKAVEIGQAIGSIEGVEIIPSPPQTNMMHVHLRGDKALLEAAALDIAREEGVWMFSAVRPTSSPSRFMFELVVGDATMDLRVEEIAQLLRKLLEKAERSSLAQDG